MLKKKKNNKGFTLVELLVVIAIIGILAVVAVPALFKNIEKGKIADLEADISAIRSAALSVYADTSELPTATDLNKDTNKTQLISKELEGLSNPFGATYIVSNAEVANKSILIITPSNGISKDGVQKLINDLGSKLLSHSSAPAGGITAGTPIKIELMSK